jgi:hypothetical protein
MELFDIARLVVKEDVAAGFYVTYRFFDDVTVVALVGKSNVDAGLHIRAICADE